MELTDSLKALFIETAKSLQGSVRRMFMARTVKELEAGGQRRAERELGWGRMTIRKGRVLKKQRDSILSPNTHAEAI
jgi:hypothetical protein